VEDSSLSELREKLEAAEAEVDFLKGNLGGEEFIAIKGKKADMVGQFYWGKISIKILQQKLPQLQNSGVKVVEIFMVTI
jgi:hypothetical protein